MHCTQQSGGREGRRANRPQNAPIAGPSPRGEGPAVISCGTARRFHAQETSQEEPAGGSRLSPAGGYYPHSGPWGRDGVDHRISHSR